MIYVSSGLQESLDARAPWKCPDAPYKKTSKDNDTYHQNQQPLLCAALRSLVGQLEEGLQKLAQLLQQVLLSLALKLQTKIFGANLTIPACCLQMFRTN